MIDRVFLRIIVQDAAIERSFVLFFLEIWDFVLLHLGAIGLEILFVFGRALVATIGWKILRLLTPQIEIARLHVEAA